MIEAGSARCVTAQDDASPGRILVVGSANVDLVLEVPRHPLPGETLSAPAPALPGGGRRLAARAWADVSRHSPGTDDDAGCRALLASRRGLDDISAVEDVEETSWQW